MTQGKRSKGARGRVVGTACCWTTVTQGPAVAVVHPMRQFRSLLKYGIGFGRIPTWIINLLKEMCLAGRGSPGRSMALGEGERAWEGYPSRGATLLFWETQVLLLQICLLLTQIIMDWSKSGVHAIDLAIWSYVSTWKRPLWLLKFTVQRINMLK